MDRPNFQIVPKNELAKIAEKTGLEFDEYNPTAVEENEWFCVFTSAKPIEQFWRKGSTEWAGGDEIEKQIINWEKIYETAMPQIWGLMEDYEAAGLTFSRLNPPETHKPRKFYYVWRIGLEEHHPSP